MKKYYYQLYVNKFEDLGEIDKFFKRHKVPKFTQEKFIM